MGTSDSLTSPSESRLLETKGFKTMQSILKKGAFQTTIKAIGNDLGFLSIIDVVHGAIIRGFERAIYAPQNFITIVTEIIKNSVTPLIYGDSKTALLCPNARTMGEENSRLRNTIHKEVESNATIGARGRSTSPKLA